MERGLDMRNRIVKRYLYEATWIKETEDRNFMTREEKNLIQTLATKVEELEEKVLAYEAAAMVAPMSLDATATKKASTKKTAAKAEE